MHFLIKPLFHLLEPLTVVLLALTALVPWLYLRRQRGPALLVLALWLLLGITTCTALGDWLLGRIEGEWADMPARWSSLPACDVLVCLGGGVNPNPAEITGVDMIENSDRITTAIELVRRGKASFLMLGGGSARQLNGPLLSESKAVENWIQRWGLLTVPVDDLGICRNTHDEAVAFASKAREHGWKKVMLVTSASHMHRAAAVFRKTTGLEVVPAACAFRTGVAVKEGISEWVHFPAINSLDQLSVWIYETVGWWTYRAQGWVD